MVLPSGEEKEEEIASGRVELIHAFVAINLMGTAFLKEEQGDMLKMYLFGRTINSIVQVAAHAAIVFQNVLCQL